MRQLLAQIFLFNRGPAEPGDLFVPLGSDSFITVDGFTFRVTPP